jgi:hypothetical protein
MVDTLNGDEFIIKGKGDFTDLYNKLIAAGYTADEVMTYLKSLAGSGVSFEVEYGDPIYMEDPISGR